MPRLVPRSAEIYEEPSALSASPELVMQRARAAVGAAEPEELRVAGMLVPRQAVMTPSAPAEAPPVAPQAVPPEVSAALAAQSVVPKGGVPRRISGQEAESYALGDRMAEAAALEKHALNRTSGQNFLAKMGHRIAGAGLALPSVAADIATAPAAAARYGFDLATGQPTTPILGRTPQLTPEHVAAGIDTLQGKDYNTQLERYRAVEKITDDAFQWSSVGGKVAGDVGTILTGRVPFARASAAGALAKQTARHAGAEAAEKGPLGWTRAKAAALNSKFANWARKTGARVGETGAEGAALAVLHDGDPVSQATYTGGAQLAGSTLLALAHHPAKSLIGSLVLWQTAQNLTPVEGTSIDWTLQHILDKATVAGVAGVVAGALGAGRVRGAPIGGKWLENFPKVAEGISGTLRTNATSLWEQMTNDGQRDKPVIAPIMKKLSTDVSAFKPDEIRRLERGSMKGGDLTATILDLSRNADFRKRMGL